MPDDIMHNTHIIIIYYHLLHPQNTQYKSDNSIAYKRDKPETDSLYKGLSQKD